MGYATIYTGKFDLDRPLLPEHKTYLEEFSTKKRLVRDVSLLEDRPDPARIAAGLPLGHLGIFFTGGQGYKGQDKKDVSVLREGCTEFPSNWCQWTPSIDGEAILWDGEENFYGSKEWLEILIRDLLEPWGYVLNGGVYWDGGAPGDTGYLKVISNEIEVFPLSEIESLLESIDLLLMRNKDRLPLYMGLNDTIDKRVKRLLNKKGGANGEVQNSHKHEHYLQTNSRIEVEGWKSTKQ